MCVFGEGLHRGCTFVRGRIVIFRAPQAPVRSMHAYSFREGGWSVVGVASPACAVPHPSVLHALGQFTLCDYSNGAECKYGEPGKLAFPPFAKLALETLR